MKPIARERRGIGACDAARGRAGMKFERVSARARGT